MRSSPWWTRPTSGRPTATPRAEGQLAGEDTPRGLAGLLAEQLEFADVVLLNKTDLAGEEATARLESFVRELNPRARIVPTRFGDVDPETLLYTGSFDLAEVDETEEWQAAEAELEHIVEEDEDEDEDDHDDHEDEEDSFGFTSFVYETGRPFDLDRLRREIFERWGSVAAGVVRSKGVLQAAGSDEAIQWNQAGGRCALELVGTWAPGAARQTQLVFIGRELDADAVTEALDACTVEPAPAAPAGRPRRRRPAAPGW